MKNRRGTLDCILGILKFKFRNENFVISLNKGESVYWSHLELLDGSMFSLKFSFEGDSPKATVYGYTRDEHYDYITDYSVFTEIKIVGISGTKSDYMGLPFDSTRIVKFNLLDGSEVLYKTKKLNKLSDKKVNKEQFEGYKNLSCLAIDANGATQLF